MSDASRRFLPFSALAKHLETQVRGMTTPSVVNRYRLAMRNGETFPPLTVADVNGALILVDGFHRRAALEALGEWQAECEIVPCKSIDEALWLAFHANLRHGQPLKAKALRPAFRAYVKAGMNVGADGVLQSYRDIATSIPGTSYTTYWRWMQQDFPSVFTAMAGGTDEAEGGLRSKHANIPDPPYDLTMKALDLLDDAQALMEGVNIPEYRQRVAERARMLSVSLEIWGVGTGRKDIANQGF